MQSVKLAFKKFNRTINNLSSSKVVIYLLLLLIPLPIYYHWFTFDIFNYGDWSYKFSGTLKEYLNISPWISSVDHGSFDELLWRMPLNILYGVAATVGLSFSVIEKIFVFWPLAITSSFAPYILVHYITKSKFAALIAAVFYTTNTYFLAINPQGHILLPLACNVLTFSLYFYIKALHENRVMHFLLCSLLLSTAGYIDFRLFYIGIFIFFFYLVYWLYISNEKLLVVVRSLWKNMAIFSVSTLLLQLFWILPAYTARGGASNEVLSRALFGNEFQDLLSAITLHHPFWSGGQTTWFITNTPPLLYWLIPFLAFSALLLKRSNIHVIFFSFIALLGILLSKQIDQPFSSLYQLLFDNLPGFSAFREATKFYYLVLIGYSVLIGTVIATLLKSKSKYAPRYILACACIIIVGIGLVNSTPYIDGSMQKLFKSREIPTEYLALKPEIEKNNSASAIERTLWVPTISKWGYFDTLNPRTNLMSSVNIMGELTDTPISRSSTKHAFDFIQSASFEDYLKNASIKRVAVPIRDLANDEDLFRFYGFDRNAFIRALDKVNSLRKIPQRNTELVVYENIDYQPYFKAVNSLFTIAEDDPRANAIEFGKLTLGPINYTSDSLSPVSKIQDITLPKNSTSYQPGLYKTAVDIQKNTSIYFNENIKSVSYNYRPGEVTFTAKSVPLTYNDGVISNTQSSDQEIKKLSIDDNKNYYLKDDDGIMTPLRKGFHDLGIAHKKLSLISTNKSSLIPNESFENGLWNQSVEICNSYPGKAQVSLDYLKGDTPEGSGYIRLGAGNQAACTTSQTASIEPSTDYQIELSYRSLYGERLSFKIIYDNGTQETIDLPISNGSENWRTVRHIITSPVEATGLKIQLIGLPPSEYRYNESIKEYTDFDSIRLQKIDKEDELDFDIEKHFRAQSVDQNKIEFEYRNSLLKPDNIIKNGSFEKGLWAKEVRDCGIYDDKKPEITMSLANDSSDGKASLELSAKTHAACTSYDKIPVDESKAYNLTFDHKSLGSKQASYSVVFDDPESTSFRKYIDSGASWQHATNLIKAPVGAKSFRLTVYSDSYSQTGIESTNRYDNFKLAEIPDMDNQIYSVSNQSPHLKLPDISFESINASKKEIHIKNASGQFWLLMSENFNKHWALTNDRLEKINTEHVKANSVSNAWKITPDTLCKTYDVCTKDKDGNYDIHITAYFSPQTQLYYGSFISAVSALTISTAVLILWRRRDR